MNRKPSWVKGQRQAIILIAGCGLARFIYILIMFHLGEWGQEQMGYCMKQLAWLLYLAFTSLVFYVFTNVDDEAFEPFNRLLIPFSRVQIVILITILWPIVVPIAIVSYLRERNQ
jgi:hypothetical protein